MFEIGCFVNIDFIEEFILWIIFLMYLILLGFNLIGNLFVVFIGK